MKVIVAGTRRGIPRGFRTAVPALIERVRELEAEVDRLRRGTR